jgi:hypothetical protein
MKRDRIATDDEVLNALAGELLQQLSEVEGKIHS